MKKSILAALAAFALCASAMAQATKPTVMVVPADNWCMKHNYMQTFDNQGQTVRIPDYKLALQSSSELGNAIHKIQEMMNERGFPLKDLEQTLKSLEAQSAEDAMLQSRDGASVAESPVDKLKKTAKADIIMQLNWDITAMGPKAKINIELNGLDAYTNKNVAASNGSLPPVAGVDPISLIQQAVLQYIDGFNGQLLNYFGDMAVKGREVSARIKVWDGWEDGLETEFDGTELSEIIETWFTDNCVEGRNHLSDATENFMYFDEVRIPLFDTAGKPTDTRKWMNTLRKFLKDKYAIESKLMMKGLGEAQLVIGGK